MRDHRQPTPSGPHAHRHGDEPEHQRLIARGRHDRHVFERRRYSGTLRRDAGRRRAHASVLALFVPWQKVNEWIRATFVGKHRITRTGKAKSAGKQSRISSDSNWLASSPVNTSKPFSPTSRTPREPWRAALAPVS